MTPNELAYLYKTGVQHHKAGALQEAAKAYVKVLRYKPDHADSLHLLGVVAYQQENYTRAIDLIQQAIKLRSNKASYFNNLGNALKDADRKAEAEAAYQEAVRLNPKYAGALYNLGMFAQSKNDIDEATAYFSQAIACNNTYLDAYLGLGKALHVKGQFGAARQRFHLALRLDPNHADTYLYLGNLEVAESKYEEATRVLKHALTLDPDSTATHLALARIQITKGNHPEALRLLHKTLALDDELPQAHFMLGGILDMKGDLEEAQAAFERGLALEPESIIDPIYRLSQIKRKLADWMDYDAMCQQLVNLSATYIEEQDDLALSPLVLNASPVPAAIRTGVARRRGAIFYRQMAEARAKQNFQHSRQTPGKLRIGYVSPDFRQHAVGLLIEHMFGHHDQDAFDIYCYALAELEDDLTETIKADATVFRNISDLSHEDAAQRIYDDGIHILVDMAGYTAHSRTEIFAQKPAPIQAHYLGYLDSMQAPYIPYIIADETVISDAMRADFSEAVVYMPECFAVAKQLPFSDKPMTRAQFNLPEDAFVYCCYNGLHKFEPHVFDAWMRILKRVPGSVLWLCPSSTQTAATNLRDEAAKRGVAPERIIYTNKRPIPEYVARHQLADLFLDTFLYNAGATAIAALSGGLPILTKLGNTFLSRMSASMSKQIGLGDMICNSEENYEERAVYLGTHPEAMTLLRQRLANQVATAPLFNTARFVAHLESAYRSMWADYVAGIPPRDICVKPLPSMSQ